MASFVQKLFTALDPKLSSNGYFSKLCNTFRDVLNIAKEKLDIVFHFIDDKIGLEGNILVTSILLVILIFGVKRGSRYVIPVLSFLISLLSLMRVSICVEKQSSTRIFNGRLKIPELAVFSLGLIMLELSLNSLIIGLFGYHQIKKRATKYAWMNCVKNIIGYLSSITLNWSTFLSITELAQNSHKAALLSIFPLIGILRTAVRLISKIFVTKEESTWDTQQKSWDTNNVRMRSVIEDLCNIRVIYYLYILYAGSISTLTYSLWSLTDDKAVLSILFLDLIWPFIVSQVDRRLHLSDKNECLLSNVASLGKSGLFYRLVCTHLPIKDIRAKDYSIVIRKARIKFPENVRLLMKTLSQAIKSFMFFCSGPIKRGAQNITFYIQNGSSYMSESGSRIISDMTSFLQHGVDHVKAWWELEYTVLVVLVVFSLIIYKRRPGNLRQMILQIIPGLSVLLATGCQMHLSSGLVNGEMIFQGRLSSPSLGVLGTGLLILHAVIETIQKEIYGYGVTNFPMDERCSTVLNAMKIFIKYEIIVIFTWATFITFPIDLKTMNLKTLALSVFPIIGLLRAMNEYFTSDIEEKTANSIDKVTNEDKQGVKTTSKNGNLVSQKVQRPKHRSNIVYLCLIQLHWDRINKFVIRVGSTFAIAYTFWYLTNDAKVITIPLVDDLIPYSVSIARERNSITDNTAHLLFEVARLSGGLFYYYLFREYSHGNPQPIKNISNELVNETESRTESGLEFIEIDFPNEGACIPVKREGKIVCKEVEEVLNIPLNEDCVPMHKNGEWSCREEDVPPEPETGICTIVIRNGRLECKEGGDVKIPSEQILNAFDNPKNENCVMMKKDGKWICKQEQSVSLTETKPQVGPGNHQKTYQHVPPSPIDIWTAAVWTWGAIAGTFYAYNHRNA